MHSITDLTTFARKTSGDVPPHLVGASSTIVLSKLYVFGGRFNVGDQMASDIYELDLKTWIWTKLESHPEDDIPAPRYFHSTDAWNSLLVVFGGMGYKDEATAFEKDDLRVYDDIRFFSLSTRRWLPADPNATLPDGRPHLIPGARYAHLSSVNGNKLTIIGGQDLDGQWLGDVHIYDLKSRLWISKVEYPKYCGAYRSIAVSSPYRVVAPQNEDPESSGFPGVHPQFQLQNAPLQPFRQRAPLVHLPYSSIPDKADENEILLYSNYNFTDVKRELVVFKPTEDGDLTLTDKSDSMGGASLPPGLRFPTGAVIGTHIIIAGTYLAHTHQSFSIWTLDLNTMCWSRLEPGAVLSSGSWCRGCLWEEENKFLVFGNRSGSLVDDYNRRILSWDDIATIDLEAYGIYTPPKLQLDLTAQELGLAALEEELLADFEVICDDGRRIKCNRKVLERRWPWFEQQRRLYLASASKALESIPKTDADVPLPPVSNSSDSDDIPPDPRLTPRSFYLSEPYAITLGFLQYLYSLSLITSLQHAPAVLSGLLLLATTYELPHLTSLVKHAMHRMLSQQTSVGVYEMATICDCQNLQIRALKYVMMGNRKPGARPITRESDSSDRHPDGNSDSGGGGGTNGSAPRRRGSSDPYTRSDTSDSNPTTTNGGYHGTGRTMNADSSTDTAKQNATSSSYPLRVSRRSPILTNLTPIPERSPFADTLLQALDAHAQSRRKLSVESTLPSYGDVVRVSAAIPHRRAWTSTGDINVVTPRQRKTGPKSGHERIVRPYRSSGSLSQLTSESEADGHHSSGTPALTRSSSVQTPSRIHDIDDKTTPVGSPATIESPYVVTPVDNVQIQYPNIPSHRVIDGYWGNPAPVMITDSNNEGSTFLDFYDSDARSFLTDADPFAASVVSRKPRPTERLRHTSSTPAISLASRAAFPDSPKSNYQTISESEDTHSEFGHSSECHAQFAIRQEKSIFSRLRAFSVGPPVRSTKGSKATKVSRGLGVSWTS